MKIIHRMVVGFFCKTSSLCFSLGCWSNCKSQAERVAFILKHSPFFFKLHYPYPPKFGVTELSPYPLSFGKITKLELFGMVQANTCAQSAFLTDRLLVCLLAGMRHRLTSPVILAFHSHWRDNKKLKSLLCEFLYHLAVA